MLAHPHLQIQFSNSQDALGLENVIASEAKQSSARIRQFWIASSLRSS
jgi:hypothetical protein